MNFNQSTLLLIIPEHSDDTLCLAKQSMHFGSPRPNAGEGNLSSQPVAVSHQLVEVSNLQSSVRSATELWRQQAGAA